MISKATTERIVAEIINWKGLNNLSDQSILELLIAISDVPGNKSFSASIKVLIEEYEAML